jgi:GT2 family glycosyltransferase
MRLLIVIVNYRTPALAVDCLRSLEPEVKSIPGCQVCVVDGASGDGSAELIGKSIGDNDWQGWCVLRPLSLNGGFAFGNNAGIQPYLSGDDKPDLVLLLNPDTIVRPGAIQTLLQYMLDHPDVGIAGSRTTWPRRHASDVGVSISVHRQRDRRLTAAGTGVEVIKTRHRRPAATRSRNRHRLGRRREHDRAA